MQTASSSGVPTASMNGRRMGIASASRIAPYNPPKIEDVKDAPKARPASPRFAIGWPSSTVAADPIAPGTPNRIAGTVSDVAVTAHMPIRKASAVCASIAWVKGMSSARPPRPPMPGRMPMMRPSTTPNITMAKRAGSNTIARAEMALSMSKAGTSGGGADYTISSPCRHAMARGGSQKRVGPRRVARGDCGLYSLALSAMHEAPHA